MKKRGWLVWCLGLLVGLLAVLPEEAAAIPAFARRHQTSCSTCHAPFPKLKPYGDEFAGDGFAIPAEDRDRDYVSAGDDLLRLSRDFPIAARIDAYGVFAEDEEVDNDLQTPWGLKLLSGGTLYRNIGYYFYFYMSERGEVAGIEDAYVHFNDIAGQPWDVMVGQFQTSDPLMKRELRLTFEDYQIYKVRPGGSATNLAYDRGVMVTYGIDLSGTDLVGMIVNGNGAAEAGDDHKFDRDSFKNFGVRVSQGIGEQLALGGFFYQGQEKARPGRENEVVYYGPDLNAAFGPVELTAQYLLRTDSAPTTVYRPDGAGPKKDMETSGIVAEMILAPQLDRSRWLVTLLYNQVNCDPDDLIEADYETVTGSFTYLVARNLRLIAEVTHDVEAERNRGVLGLVAAF